MTQVHIESGARKNRSRLRGAQVLTTSYFLVEVVAGWLTGSLALLADAGHMLTDVAGLALALFAILMGERSPTPERTYDVVRSLVAYLGLRLRGPAGRRESSVRPWEGRAAGGTRDRGGSPRRG
jgi:Co/Zn/Cd efflux system component